MLCAISEETPQDAVISVKSGHVFERRLIEKHIKATGSCPVTSQALSIEDLVDVQVKTPFKPRPANLSSMPALLQTVQNEWDSVMLETYQLKQQLQDTRKNLAQALYENDAAFRVIARLITERDEAKAALAELKFTGGAPQQGPASTGGSAMEIDEKEEGLGSDVVARIEQANAELMKGRKKRIKARARAAAKADEIKAYTASATISPHSTNKPGVNCLALHPTQNNLLVSGGNDSNVVVTDRVSGKIVDTLKGHRKKVTDVAYLSNDIVVSASADNKAIVWGQTNGRYTARHTFSGHSGEVVGLAVHPTNDFLVTASADKSWSFHDLASGRTRNTLEGNSAYSAIAFHPDGKMLGACTADRVVKMIDVQSGVIPATLDGHPGNLSSLAFSENGYYLATGDDQGVIKLWDLRKVISFKTIQDAAITSVSDLSFDNSGSYLSVGGSDVRVFSTSDWSLVNSYGDHRSTVTGVRFADSAAFFASSSLDRTVKIWTPPQ